MQASPPAPGELTTAQTALDINAREPGPDGNPRLAVNARLKQAAVLLPAASRLIDDGGVQERIWLVRPATRETMARTELDASKWRRADNATCHREPRFQQLSIPVLFARMGSARQSRSTTSGT